MRPIEIGKFLFRLVKHLIILFLVSLPLQALGFILVPLGIVCSRFANQERLPKALRWYDSADLYLDRDKSVYRAQIATGFMSQYYWLSCRNPLNYLGYFVLGVTTKDGCVVVHTTAESLKVGDSAGKHAGFLYQELLDSEGKVYAYEYYLIVRFSVSKCLRARLGYKIGTNNNPGDLIEQVLILQPYKSYTGL